MPITLEEIRKDKSIIRGSFSTSEIEGTKNFISHMRNLGYEYSIHKYIDNDMNVFAIDGFMAISSENPKVGVLFVKTVVSKSLFGKKYSYRMYIAKDSDLSNIDPKHNNYRNYFDAFEDFSGLRDGMKIND